MSPTSTARGFGIVLLALAAACGDGDRPMTPVSDAPAAPAPPVSEGPGVGAGAGDRTDSGTGYPAESPPPVAGPEPAHPELGVQVGTVPAFTGSLYDADSFPVDELIAVLPRDAIPAIENPPMVRRDRVDYLSDGDLVFGVVGGGEARAYPHNIGWWHEIVNDVVGGQPVSVTFCPLTGTGLVFDGTDEDGGRFTLGVSGMLYNTNLVMYNRRDNSSLYPQIYAAGIRGPDTGKALRLLPVVETTWRAWKRLYPDTKVIARGSYGTSQYTIYPYGDYRTDDSDFLFRVRPSVSANPNEYARMFGSKDRVLGVRIEAEAMAFPFDEMGDRRVVNEVVGGLEIAVVYDGASRLAIPYSRRVVGRVLTFDLEEDGSFPFALVDRETGTRWDIRGLGVEGELAGQRLTQVPAHNSMWFAWVTFWPNTDVWVP